MEHHKKHIPLPDNQSHNHYYVLLVFSSLIILGKLSGLIRDLMLTYFLGISEFTDAYFLATTASSLTFIGLYGAVPLVIIPAYSKLRKSIKKPEVYSVQLKSALSLFLSTSIILTIFTWLFTETIISSLLGENAQSTSRMILAEKLLRIMSLSYTISTIVAFITAILSVEGRPIHVYWVPIFTNTFFCFGLILSDEKNNLFTALIMAQIGWAVLLIQLSFFARKSVTFILNGSSKPHLKSLLNSAKTAIPATLSLYIEQISLLICTFVAAQLSVGSISTFNYATKLNLLFLSIFTLILTSSLFPFISSITHNKEYTKLKKTLDSWCRNVFLTATPVTIYLAIFSDKFVSLIYQRGQFSATDSQGVANAFTWLILSLPFALSREILNRALFALGKSTTVFIISLSSNLLLFLLAFFVFHESELEGLVLSYTLTVVFQLFLNILALQKSKIELLTPLVKIMLFTASISGLSAIFSYYASPVFSEQTWMIFFFIFFIFYLAALYLLKNPELHTLKLKIYKIW
jgi:putative peptidoglycan lipid II flippase